MTARPVFDNAWWLACQAALRAACANRDAAAGFDWDKITAKNAALHAAYEAKVKACAVKIKEARAARSESITSRANADYRAMCDKDVESAIAARDRLIAARPKYLEYRAKPHQPAIWVSRVAFTWINSRGEMVKAKAVKQMKVPALCYWPGGALPAGFAVLQSDGTLPTFQGWYDAAEQQADSDLHASWKVLDKGNLGNAGNPSFRHDAKPESESAPAPLEIEVALNQPAHIEPESAPVDVSPAAPVPETIEQESTLESQWPAHDAIEPAIIQPDEDARIAADLAALAEFNQQTATLEREETMNDLRRLADVPGRAIPENSRVVSNAAGDMVFFYAKPFETKKGKKGASLYAKAFRAGARKHEWHHIFPCEDSRAKAAGEFLAGAKVQEAV